MSQTARVKRLNAVKEPAQGTWVLYWMQASQRVRFNHALELAIHQAAELNKPLLVCFGLTESYPMANARHYRFMLEGLQQTAKELQHRGIGFTLRLGSPEKVALKLSEDAAVVITDRGYLRHQKAWRQKLAEQCPAPVYQVETDVVVPVEVVSNKQEYAARTIRPKIHKHLDSFLEPLQPCDLAVESLDLDTANQGESLEDIDALLEKLDIDRSVKPVRQFKGGTGEALRQLEAFIDNRLESYAEKRNEPALNHLSHLSPYLHFGQISPVETALRIRGHDGPGPDAFFEELVVRRELAINFCNYNENYDSYDGLPDWARETLDEHRNDAREYLYSREELERAETHDSYWNAAQVQMTRDGKMHGYMRMYWAKKILEWMATPEEAFETCIYLNDRYELDGRDPNGYAGVSWCFGTHDRGWTERPVFGKVRYMNANGLKRKFDIDTYKEQILDRPE